MSCRMAYCNKPATRYGIYCSTHKSARRRHGHPSQRGVSKTELAPYVKLVRLRKRKNPDSPFWQATAGRWRGLIEHCRGVVNTYYSGQAMVGWEVRACDSIVKLAGSVEADKVVETALAMYLMWELDPRRFVSDDAFWTQLVRRVRGLSEVNASHYWDHRTGRRKRVYRDLPPRVTKIMAELLVKTFGTPGVMLAKREAEDLAKGKENVKVLGEAVRALQ